MFVLALSLLVLGLFLVCETVRLSLLGVELNMDC